MRVKIIIIIILTKKQTKKKTSDMLLSPLECIVVVEVSVAVLLLLHIHQMGCFTLLGIFILELFLTREIRKINYKKTF